MILEIVKVFATCLILTIIIEGITSFILGYRSLKEQLIVLLINVATNPVAVYCSWIISLLKNNVLKNCLVVLVEIVVVIVETIMLKKFNTKKKLPFFLIALINNATSFILGLFINI